MSDPTASAGSGGLQTQAPGLPDALLTIADVRAGYGAIEALHGVSLHVNTGEIVCLLGANGAGKSTLLLSCSGIVRCRSGRITLAGQRLDTLPAHAVVARGLVQVPEGRRIFPRLTVTENLCLGAWTRNCVDPADLARCYDLFPILGDRRHQAGGTLSGGEQQMLAIARALMARPRILLLDEPSMGVAPQLCARIFATLRQLNRDGLTILLVEQDAHAALALAHRGYVLDTGCIAVSGSADDLRRNEAVQRAYLG